LSRKNDALCKREIFLSTSKKEDMRKLLLTGAALFVAVILWSQSAFIEVQGPAQVCAGYTSANQVRVTAIPNKSPFDMGGKASIAYVWMAEHENGNKVWFSNQPNRWVPIPWAGQYRVRAIFEYVMPGRSRPFAAITSNTLIITGIECNNSNMRSASPKSF
jgi:hypothetical protein